MEYRPRYTLRMAKKQGDQRFLSEVARDTGLTPSYLRRMVRHGRIAAHRVPQGGTTYAYVVPPFGSSTHKKGRCRWKLIRLIGRNGWSGEKGASEQANRLRLPGSQSGGLRLRSMPENGASCPKKRQRTPCGGAIYSNP